MTALILSKQKCSQCLCSKDRIVSGERAAEIVKECLETGNHFICHKSSSGEIVHCRGVHDLHPNGSNAYQLAKRLRIPIEERNMDE